MEPVNARQRRASTVASLALTASDAPLVKSSVALIFVLFVILGAVLGYLAGTAPAWRRR